MQRPLALPATALAALLALTLAGCGGNPELTVSPPGPEMENPPLPETAPEPRPHPFEGVYVMSEVARTPLPAVVDSAGGCVLRIVSGGLTLRDGRFAFRNTTQETCGGTARPAVAHHAVGRYRLRGPELHLRADSGTAFSTAEAQLLDDDVIRVVELATEGGGRAVSWDFRKEGPREEVDGGS